MALLTTAAIQGYCDYTKRRLAYAKYKIDSTYYKALISSVDVSTAGLVKVTFNIDIASGSGTVKEVQLYDTDNQLWLSKTESLALSSVTEGFYYVVNLTIAEVTS